MRKPQIRARRALGIALVASLAVAAAVGFAGTSQAAVIKLKADLNTSAGATLTVIGTDLLDDGGAPNYSLTGVRYSTVTCPASPATASATTTGWTGSAAQSAIAVSDTKFTVSTVGFTPTLTAGKAKYNVCLYDASNALFGTGSTTFYSPPATITAGVATLADSAVSNIFVGSAEVNAAGTLTGASLGGTKITVKGLDFTAKTYVTVGGKKLGAAKTTIAKVNTDADVITGTVPAGTGTQAIKLVGEFGNYPVGISGVASGAALSWVYTPSVQIAPTGSDGAVGRVITVTGVGFDARTFVTATGTGTGGGMSIVALVPPAVANTAWITSNNSATPAGAFLCSTVVKESDTELTCTIPSLASALGAYSVRVVTFAGAAGAQTLDTTNTTGYTRSATYTAGPA